MKRPGTIERLTVDHELIAAFLDHFIAYCRRIDRGEQPSPAPELVLEFIESFIERFHHAREEQILFEHLLRSSKFDRVMARRLVHDHHDARHHVDGMRQVLDMRTPDRRTAWVWNGLGYAQLTREHIAREARETYPAAASLIHPQDEALLAERFDRISPNEAEFWAAARELIVQMDQTLERAAGA
ncbi:MAG: hemerythrin domain-containing protein [Planctomycetes bacterium]|nr:hemerythrin domain-containing protein [Planctomycetota bacterium]